MFQILAVAGHHHSRPAFLVAFAVAVGLPALVVALSGLLAESQIRAEKRARDRRES